MAAARIQRTKTSAAVVDYLLDEIFAGHLRTGDRIDLEEVATELGVSRLPVREALLILERDGIVATTHYRGSFVEPFDAESVMDDFEILGLLSGVAVARLARKQDPDVIDQLRQLIDQLRATPPDHKERAADIVQEILRTEHRAGGSRRLRAELRAHAGFLPWVFRVIPERSHESTVRAHSRVVRAIAAGDPEAASRHRVEDLRAAGRSVIRELVRRGVLEKLG